MKTIILYTRRNVGLYSLAFLKGLGYEVRVITDDENVMWLACVLECELVNLDTMGEFDLFLCIHGDRIIKENYLKKGVFVNIHPCLNKYKGINPVEKYIANKNKVADVSSHYMIKEVDEGEIIHQEIFMTGEVNTFAEFYNIAMPYYFKCIDRTLKQVL